MKKPMNQKIDALHDGDWLKAEIRELVREGIKRGWDAADNGHAPSYRKDAVREIMDGPPKNRCKPCKGTGYARAVSGHACPECKGSGKAKRCRTCGGKGYAGVIDCIACPTCRPKKKKRKYTMVPDIRDDPGGYGAMSFGKKRLYEKPKARPTCPECHKKVPARYAAHPRSHPDCTQAGR